MEQDIFKIWRCLTLTDKEMIKRVDDLLYLERQLTSAICEAVKDVQRGYLKGRDTMPSDVYERLRYIIDEAERLDKRK